MFLLMTLVASALGHCPNGEFVRLDFTQGVTIHEHGSTVYGVEYPLGVVEAKVPAGDDSIKVLMTASKKSSNAPAPANVYDCVTGTEDVDLNESCSKASVEKAIIIQEMNRGSYNMDLPDDDWRGGTLRFEFLTPDLVSVEILDVTLLDFERFSTFEIISTDDKTSMYGIPAGDDGSYQKINTYGSGNVEQMIVKLPDSGGVGMIKMCVENRRVPSIMGDPHVRTIDNHQVDVFFPVGLWVPMMTGSDFALFGHVFNKPGDLATQWIDGLAVVDAETEETVLNVTIPHDKAVGHVHDRDAISYLQVELNGVDINATNQVYYSKKENRTTLKLDAAKLRSHVRGGRSPIYNDKLTVETSHFTFVAQISRETNRKLFDSFQEQMRYTHLDVAFPVIDAESVTGPLVDLIYRKNTRDAKAWQNKANALRQAVL